MLHLQWHLIIHRGKIPDIGGYVKNQLLTVSTYEQED
jgi:hypothetical protein